MVKQRVREDRSGGISKYYPEYRWMWMWFKYELSVLGYCATLEVAREVLARAKPKPKPVTTYHAATDTESHQPQTQKARAPNWTDTQNDRRVELIDRDIDCNGDLAPIEVMELAGLTKRFLAWKAEKCPLPIEEVKAIRQTLEKSAK